MTRQNHQFKAGEILQGKYLIREQLGDGASGTVYVAEHLVLSAEVAIKVLHPRFAENELMRRRFLDEARTLARLKSRYIVRILDADLDSSGIAFIAMEYVGGSDLEKYISTNAPLSPSETLRIAIEVCGALQEAHACGIVHRDIKPENILLTQDAGGQLHVKVADFGLAKRVHLKLSRQSTSNDQPIGTPCYMAPEQMLRPAEVDHRADIFSMGVLLYEMLTGFLPFGGDTVEQTMQSVLSTEPTSASDLDERIPLALSELIERCLVKDPEHRLGSIEQLASELSLIARTLLPSSPPQIPFELTSARSRRDSSWTSSAPAVVSIASPEVTKPRRSAGWVLAFAAAAALVGGSLLYTQESSTQWSSAAQWSRAKHEQLKEKLGFQLTEDRLPSVPFALKHTPRSFHTALPEWEKLSLASDADQESIELPAEGAETSSAPYIPQVKGQVTAASSQTHSKALKIPTRRQSTLSNSSSGATPVKEGSDGQPEAGHEEQESSSVSETLDSRIPSEVYSSADLESTSSQAESAASQAESAASQAESAASQDAAPTY